MRHICCCRTHCSCRGLPSVAARQTEVRETPTVSPFLLSACRYIYIYIYQAPVSDIYIYIYIYIKLLSLIYIYISISCLFVSLLLSLCVYEYYRYEICSCRFLLSLSVICLWRLLPCSSAGLIVNPLLLSVSLSTVISLPASSSL